MRKPLIIKLFVAFVLLTVSFSVVSVLTPYGSSTTPDSLSYLDMAANIKNGKGALETDFSIEYQEHHALKEQRSWPPLYSLLLSTAVSDYADVSAVANVSKILLFISLLMVYGVIRTQTQWHVALFSSCLFSISVPIMTIYANAWSETLFVSLLAIATWTSIKYLELDRESAFKKVTFLAILLVTVILLTYTRYIGIVFVLLLPAVYLLSKKDKYDLSLFLVAGFVYTLVVGYLLADNYLVTGSLSGVPRSPSDRNVAENIDDMFFAVKVMLPSSVFSVLLSLMVSIVVSYIYRNKRSQHNTSNAANANLTRSVVILSLIVALYIFALVMLRSYSNFDRIDIRLLSPAFPAFFMLLIILPLLLDIKSKSGTALRFCFVFLVIAFSIQGYSKFIEALENWEKNDRYDFSGHPGINYGNFTMNPNANIIKRKFPTLVTGNGVIVIDTPLRYRFISGVNCVQKPYFIDSKIFKKINMLPEGSVFIYDKEEKYPFALLNNDHKIEYKHYDLGYAFYVKIPMEAFSSG